jgi:hypothetical protein
MTIAGAGRQEGRKKIACVFWSFRVSIHTSMGELVCQVNKNGKNAMVNGEVSSVRMTNTTFVRQYLTFQTSNLH